MKDAVKFIYVYINFWALNGFYLIDYQAKANFQLSTINCPLILKFIANTKSNFSTRAVRISFQHFIGFAEELNQLNWLI